MVPELAPFATLPRVPIVSAVRLSKPSMLLKTRAFMYSAPVTPLEVKSRESELRFSVTPAGIVSVNERTGPERAVALEVPTSPRESRSELPLPPLSLSAAMV